MQITGSCPGCRRAVDYPTKRCPVCGVTVHHWDAIARQVLRTQPARSDVKVPAASVGDPAVEGYEERHPNPTTDARDLRKRAGDVVDDGGAPDERGVHVKDYGAFYRVHWDRIDPAVDPVAHLRRDIPGATLVGSVVAAGALVAAATR